MFISLCKEGFAGEVVLISDVLALPYQKPPLSKGYLQGKQGEESLLFRAVTWYETNRIDLRLGVTVSQIAPLNQVILTSTGELIFSIITSIILATGAVNRPLHTLADTRHIGQKIDKANRVAIIGGGFTGLELAAVAVEKASR